VLVREQLFDVLDNGVGICADDAREAGFSGLWPLSRLAQHQNRHTERWRFFLNPSRIGEDQIGATHQR